MILGEVNTGLKNVKRLLRPCQCDRDLTINLPRIFCRLTVKNDASQVTQTLGVLDYFFAQLISYILIILQGHAWDRLMENKH